MSDNEKSKQCIEGEVLSTSSTPRKPARIRLGNIRDVRHEAARVYREARDGVIPAQEATRFIYMLLSLSNMIKDSELEERIIALEKLNDSSAQK